MCATILGNFFPMKCLIDFKGANVKRVKAKAMMRVIRKESPPEHWDNSMTTRTLLLVISLPIGKTLEEVLKGSLFGAGDDFFLMVFIQIDEIITVTGDPDKQVPVLIGCVLSFSQGL